MLLPFTRNKLFKATQWAYSHVVDNGYPAYEEVTSLDEANVISSLIDPVKFDLADVEPTPKLHTVVLDIYVPATMVDSTSPGHHHLFIDSVMTQDTYFALLDALANAGVIEQGYANASKARGFSAVRLPWVKKEPELEKVDE